MGSGTCLEDLAAILVQETVGPQALPWIPKVLELIRGIGLQPKCEDQEAGGPRLSAGAGLTAQGSLGPLQSRRGRSEAVIQPGLTLFLQDSMGSTGPEQL